MANEAIHKCHSVRGTKIFQLSTEQGQDGRLKGRCRVLMRKCESKKKTTQAMTLACIVLHNICIELEDATPNCWDQTVDDMGRKRPQDEVRELFIMTKSPRRCDNNFESWQDKRCIEAKVFLEQRGEGVL